MKERAPAFQFYPRQFAGDDAVMAMDLDAIGAHILLMCAAGASPECCRIAADERAIRNRVRNPGDEDWQRIKSQLLAGAWKVSADGQWWVQDGLRRSFEKQKSFSEAQSERAKKRYQDAAGSMPEEMPEECRTSAGSMPEGMPASCSSSSSSSSNKRTPKASLSDEELMLVYKAYPRREAPAAARKAIRKAAERLAKVKGISQADALAMLRQRVEAYAEQKRFEGTDLQFIPLPATWFNQERYESESLIAGFSVPVLISPSPAKPVFEHRSNALSMDEIRAKAGVQ